MTGLWPGVGLAQRRRLHDAPHHVDTSDHRPHHQGDLRVKTERLRIGT
jgi:hypothetical protein